jgi:hypothetical protein
MGSDYIENDFMSPTTEEIRNARPLMAVLPEDILSRATLIASVLCAGTDRQSCGLVGGYFVRREETASAVTGQQRDVTD